MGQVFLDDKNCRKGQVMWTGGKNDMHLIRVRRGAIIKVVVDLTSTAELNHLSCCLGFQTAFSADRPVQD